MSTVRRFERFDFRSSDLASPEKTQEGYWKLEGKVARTGIQIYRDGMGGEHKEMRFPADVQKSLSGFSLCPLTNGHPPGLVTPENAQRYVSGAVGEAEYADGWVKAPITVWTKDAIDAIKAGRAQLSVGYTCKVVHEPGMHEGEHFDARQTDIVVNHVALVDAARAGREARLKLDSADAATHDFFDSAIDMVVSDSTSTDEHRETPRMLTIKIDSLDVKVESANDQAIIEKAISKARVDAESKADSALAELAAAKKQLSEAQAKADAFEAVAKAPAKCDECGGTGKVDGAACSMCGGKGTVKADELTFEARAASRARSDERAARVAGAQRAKLLTEAGRVLSANEKLDEKSDLEIKQLVIKKLDKDVVLDGKDASYVEHRYAFEMEKRGKVAPIDRIRLVEDGADKVDAEDNLTPLEKMHRHNDEAYFRNRKK
jgi:uncharacterized protein